jgi:hypothetical protein
MPFEVSGKLVDFILDLSRQFHEYMRRQDFFSALIILRTLISYTPEDYRNILIELYAPIKNKMYDDPTKDMDEKATSRVLLANDLYVLFEKINDALSAGGIFRREVTMLREEL